MLLINSKGSAQIAKMKHTALLLIFLFFLNSYSIPEKSDQEEIRELEIKLQTAQGIEKVEILNELSIYYRETGPEKSLKLNESAVKLAELINFPEGKTRAYINMGQTYYDSQKNIKKAIEMMRKSLILSERIKYKKGIMKANLKLAKIYYDENNEDEALKHYLKAEKLCYQLTDIYSELEDIYCYTGLIYWHFHDFNRALIYLKKGVQISKQAKMREDTAHFYYLIGNVNLAMKEYDTVLDSYEKSHKIYTELDKKIWTARLKNNIGYTYGELKKYDAALTYLLDALKIERKYGERADIYYTLFAIGKYYFAKKQYKKADKYFKEALAFIESTNNFTKQAFYESYSKLCYVMGKFKEAYDSLKKHMEIKDKRINVEKNKNIAELQEKYDAEIREKEIEILKKDKKIQQILFASGFLFIFIILVFIIKKYMYLFAFWKRKNYIGHYRVMEKIASGGMGTIYKAHDVQDKTKELAVKVLREEFFSDESYKKRFKNEAVVIDQFTHPNIVKVIERGETEDNIYIAMELLDGKTLNEILEEEERLDIPIALSIMAQTADALAMIHKKKITHRDIKPENIMIIKTEENPYFVKVLDFGLAKQQTLTRMTQTGIIMGSIFYLSPERITNSEITTASDIYSLGVIFYQVISGEMLFFGDTAVDIAQQILEKEPIALNKLRKDVPEELNRLITKMIDKEPGKRPPAKEVLDILKKIAGGDFICL